MTSINDLLSKWLSRQWFSAVIFFISIVITFTITFLTISIANTKEASSFESTTSRFQRTMTNRLDTYEAVLRAGSGFMIASEYVSFDEFQSFTRRLRLREKYPGIQGIGYSRYFSADEKESVLAEIQQEIPNLNFYPDHDSDYYTTIVYLEPLDDRNQAAIGYDMFSQSTRRDAMERARDTGEASLSGPVTLIQEIDEHKQVGFLMYVPVYEGEGVPLSIGERRERLLGFVYAPFRAGDLFDVIITEEPLTGIDLEIYDEKIAPENLLFSTRKIDSEQSTGDLPTYQTSSTMLIADRIWHIRFTSNPNFAYAIERNTYPVYLATGLLVSFFLFIMSRLQYKAWILAQQTKNALFSSQQALSRSRIQYRALAENTSDLVTVLDPLGNVIYASPSHADVIGYQPDELQDSNILHLIHPDDFARIQAKLATIAAGGTDRAIFQIRHKHGQYVSLEGIGTGLLDENGESAGILVTSRDITERQALERRKDEFISIASHELKTPVTSLKVFAQYLQAYFVKRNDEISVELMKKMDQQLNKLANLIRDLLDVSRIEGGDISINSTTFDLRELAEEVVEMIQLTSPHSSIKMKKFKSVLVKADRDRLSQVLVNLLSNAIKYSPENKSIIVYQRLTSRQVTVCVQDFGPGIPPNKQDMIFERFFRLEGPAQETFAGFGLGLYISAEIIRRHRGKIWVESELGKGSTFCFSLPIANQVKKTANKISKSKKSKSPTKSQLNSRSKSQLKSQPEENDA